MPGVYDAAKTVLEHLEKSLPPTLELYSRRITPQWVLTLHGVVAAQAGNYDDARKAFDEVGMKLERSAFDFARATSPRTAPECMR